MQKAFTLIELLVVVLIIGILSAVALPQYQKVVEKARMTEAIIMVRAIANAHQLYYLANGVYLGPDDMDKLDVQVPGTAASEQIGNKRIKTKDFVYSPNGCGSSCVGPEGLAGYLGLARRTSDQNPEGYSIYIRQNNPNRIWCGSYQGDSAIQQKLCKALNTAGTL